MNKYLVGLGLLTGLILLAQNEKDTAHGLVKESAVALTQPAPYSAAYVPSIATVESYPERERGDRYYGNDPCTIDCSGHEAGAEWAEDNDIDDPDDCDGNSNSFIEGCRTYVEDKLEDAASLEDDEEE